MRLDSEYPTAEDRPVAMLPGALPLLGHAHRLLRDPLRFLHSAAAYGDAVGIRLGPFDAVLVCSLALTQQLLLNDRVFDKGGPLLDAAREVADDGLVTCPHRLHRRLRRLAQPAFNRARFPAYTKVIVEQVSAITGDWPDGRPIDVFEEMARSTLRVLCATMFTMEPSRSTVDETIDDITVVAAGIYKRALTPGALLRVPTPSNRRFEKACARLRRNVARIVADHRSDGIDHGGLLSMLLAARDTAAGVECVVGRLTDAELSDQVITFLLAGSETTATALGWALLHLAQRPELEERLQLEVGQVLAGRTPDFEDVPKLQLAGRIVAESLRMYPPGWIFTRTTTTEATLGEYRIPRGKTVLYSPYIVQRNADVFHNPDVFDPDRWVGQPVTRTLPGLLAFGGGPRKCIGDNFALTEMVLTLAVIVRQWQLRMEPRTLIRPAVGFSLRTPPDLRLCPILRPDRRAPS